MSSISNAVFMPYKFLNCQPHRYHIRSHTGVLVAELQPLEGKI